MEYRGMAAVFLTVLVAELGDKTQLATMLFAADAKHGKWAVFVAASLALIVAAGLGILAGSWVARYISPRHLQYLAAIGLIGMGLWTLFRA
ncbi:MAG: TMEM165/GDT1 family protein [Brachymonas sp.]|nr:TMEM165/GDT1 family protein [Brachymonas sp.]